MIVASKGDNWGAELVACATLVVVLPLVYLVIRAIDARWPKLFNRPTQAGVKPRRSLSVFVGQDNRISTSKTVALAWTIVELFMLLTIAYVALGQSSPGEYFSTTLKATDLIYLIFLGGPYAAAVIAKVAVTNQVNNRTLQKTEGTPGPLDIISDDSGATDLYDFQYVVFNLIAMIIVLIFFVPAPAAGFPSVPDFLAALTGGAALTYTFNKAAGGGNPATLTTVAPKVARISDRVTIYGQNLAVPAIDQNSVDANTIVMVGGVAATVITAQSDQVAFTVPRYPGAQWPNVPQDVELKTNANDDVKALEALTIIP
jgi:hypothetical protein